MAEGEIATTVVSYREGDAPVALPALAVVAVKLLGLSELIQAIPQIVYLPMLIRDALAMGGGIEWVRLTYLLVNFCDLAIGIFLLWKAEWVVKRVVVPANETPPMTFDEHFQGVAFSIVGVLLIVWGVGGVATHVFTIAMNEARRNIGQIVTDVGYAGLAEPLVELAAGLVLFLRGRGLASLWHRMRYGGVRVRPAEE